MYEICYFGNILHLRSVLDRFEGRVIYDRPIIENLVPFLYRMFIKPKYNRKQPKIFTFRQYTYIIRGGMNWTVHIAKSLIFGISCGVEVGNFLNQVPGVCWNQ